MKKTKRFSALLLSLFLFFSLSACGNTADGGRNSPDADSAQASAPTEKDPSAPEDSDFHDPVFPGEKVPRLDIFTFENYKLLRDAAEEGDEALEEALSFAQTELSTSFAYEEKEVLLKTTDQLATLVSDIGGVKILLPESEDWTLSSFLRAGSRPPSINPRDGSVITNARYKKELRIGYKNEEYGFIGMRVYYGENRAHTPREFYNRECSDAGKYISPEPYFTVPLDTGETFSLFKYQDAENNAFLLTDNSEIVISFEFKFAESDEEKAKKKEEIESVLRAFLDGAKVMTLNEAAGK